MGLEIRGIDAEAEGDRQAVLEYLAPREAHALFIVANLTNRFPDSHLYAAMRDGKCVGVAGYYARPRSLIPFAEEAEVARALTRYVAERHRPIEYMNGIAYAAGPAFEELVALGAQPANDPRQVFMERALPPAGPPKGEADGLPTVPHEEKVRPMRPEEAGRVAWLLRMIQGRDLAPAVTEEEIARVGMNPFRLVVEAEGQVAATGATNGLGVRAFQILAVATDPAQRRKGYARAVCAALMRQMQGRGARQAVIFTDVKNAAARGCYAALGFAVTGEFYVARFHVDATKGCH